MKLSGLTAPLVRFELVAAIAFGSSVLAQEVDVFDDEVPEVVTVEPSEELEELQNGIPPRLQREWDDELQATFGWDWKVGCEMHVCTRDDGEVCCHQQCDGGGSKGTAYEPPDHFACMNSSAGGHYDWFLTGLRDGGISEVAACVPH